jgi:hypothetical protein
MRSLTLYTRANYAGLLLPGRKTPFKRDWHSIARCLASTSFTSRHPTGGIKPPGSLLDLVGFLATAGTRPPLQQSRAEAVSQETRMRITIPNTCIHPRPQAVPGSSHHLQLLPQRLLSSSHQWLDDSSFLCSDTHILLLPNHSHSFHRTPQRHSHSLLTIVVLSAPIT